MSIGDWLLEPALDQVSAGTLRIHLRPQLTELLVYLAGLEGRVATLESIHDDLWKGRVVSSGTIYNCIAELRRLLASNGSTMEYIATLPKRGYRLVAPVVHVPEQDAGSSGTCSIVILPLENRGRRDAIEYLCYGLAEELVLALSQVSGLRIQFARAPASVTSDPRAVGLRFGATHVLSGSLRLEGKILRATLYLESVVDGVVAWSARFERPASELLDIQEAVVRDIVQVLTPALPVEATEASVLDRSGTRNLAALNAFLLGRHVLSKFTPESQAIAIQYFEKAVHLDPGFARAHYRLYLARYLKRRMFGIDDDDDLEKARVAAENARLHGYRFPVPWVHIHRRLHPDARLSSRELALEAIDRIVARDPEWHSFAYEQLTWVLCDVALFNETLLFAKRMLDSPDLNFVDSDLDEEIPHYEAAAGRHEDAILLWSQIIQKDPVNPFFRCERAIQYLRTGRPESARLDIDAIESPAYRCLGEAFAAYYAQDEQGVRKEFDRFGRLAYQSPTQRIWMNCLVGDIDSAMQAFDIAVSDDMHSYIDFGNKRAMSRSKLPTPVVSAMETHPVFLHRLEVEGIDDAWRDELVQRLNAISHLTGIVLETHSS